LTILFFIQISIRIIGSVETCFRTPFWKHAPINDGAGQHGRIYAQKKLDLA